MSLKNTKSDVISSCVEYVQLVPNISLTTNSNFESKTVMSTTSSNSRSFALPRSSVSAAHSNFDSDQFHSEIFKQPVTNNSGSKFDAISSCVEYVQSVPNISLTTNSNFEPKTVMSTTHSNSRSFAFPRSSVLVIQILIVINFIPKFSSCLLQIIQEVVEFISMICQIHSTISIFNLMCLGLQPIISFPFL